MSSKKIVITGGPSTGKTSIIEKIEEKGYKCFPEVSRSITLEARKEGIPQLFLSDPILFSKRVLKGRLDQFIEASACTNAYVFMDRGLPDVTSYLNCFGQDYDSYFEDICFTHRYDSIFLLPPWEAIHEADNERHENFEEALRIHDFLEKGYQHYGYDIHEVPIGPVTERVNYVLEHIKSKS